MCIEDELEALRKDTEALAARAASIDDWRKLDARAFLLLLSGQMQLGSLQRSLPPRLCARVTREFLDVLEEIRGLRACAQNHVCELASPREIGHR